MPRCVRNKGHNMGCCLLCAHWGGPRRVISSGAQIEGDTNERGKCYQGHVGATSPMDGSSCSKFEWWGPAKR